jgi:hypothetical protein
MAVVGPRQIRSPPQAEFGGSASGWPAYIGASTSNFYVVRR